MANTTFIPVTGIIQNIQSVPNQCCQQMISLRTQTGTVNMLVGADTYVINNIRLRLGMSVVAFYDADLPVPLIFPPQYRAFVIGLQPFREFITVGFFNNNLVNSENTLQLNINRSTEIVTSNGQAFSCRLANRLLIVYYSATTRSIPAQTTPRKVIVMC